MNVYKIATVTYFHDPDAAPADVFGSSARSERGMSGYYVAKSIENAIEQAKAFEAYFAEQYVANELKSRDAASDERGPPLTYRTEVVWIDCLGKVNTIPLQPSEKK